VETAGVDGVSASNSGTAIPKRTPDAEDANTAETVAERMFGIQSECGKKDTVSLGCDDVQVNKAALGDEGSCGRGAIVTLPACLPSAAGLGGC
jgi:hypothetical protein